jgi:exosortase A-associated hydrolase 2
VEAVTLSRHRLVARFIDGACGRILVVARFPGQVTGRCVLVVPPFAEEMNKSRPSIAQLADRLATRGIATVLPDLGGTGDSDGEFRDADWDAWRRDIVATAAWAAAQGWPVDALLGIRLGCALAAEAVRELPEPISHAVFWAPVADGRTYLTQFLRLRVAAAMVSDGPAETTTSLRARMTAGDVLEIAGYALGPRLADRIDRIRLADIISPALGELCWMEVARSDPPAMPDAAGRAIEQARALGVRVSPLAVAGEPFWAATEIVVNRPLVDGTIAALAGPT